MDKELKEYLEAMEDRLNNKFIVALADVMEVVRDDIAKVKDDIAKVKDDIVKVKEDTSVNREVLKKMLEMQTKMQEDIEDIKISNSLLEERMLESEKKIKKLQQRLQQ